MKHPDEFRILLVDDDPAVRMVTEATLTVLGEFTVTAVDGGDKAIEMCRTDSFDLILIDVMMPNLDGPATIRQLKSAGLLRSTPFVFLTAKVQEDARHSLMTTGAIGVLAKPFDPTELVSTIDGLIGVTR